MRCRACNVQIDSGGEGRIWEDIGFCRTCNNKSLNAVGPVDANWIDPNPWEDKYIKENPPDSDE